MKRYVVAALALLSMAAHAQMYIGGAIGSSEVDSDCTLTTSCETSDTGFKIYGGYVLPRAPLPGLALEVGYIDFGKSNATRAFVTTTVEASGLLFNAAMRLKFTPALSGVGRLGLAYMEGKDNGRLGLGINPKSESDFNVYYGLGLEYSLNKQFKLTGAADFSSYDTGNQSGDAHLLSIGLEYGF